MRIFFRLLAGATLLVDAYLLLALVAVGRMKVAYHDWLPPFGNPLAKTLPASIYLILVVWTGALAIGCFLPTGPKDPNR